MDVILDRDLCFAVQDDAGRVTDVDGVWLDCGLERWMVPLMLT